MEPLTKRITIRFSAREVELIREAAEADCQRSVSNYLHRIVLLALKEFLAAREEPPPRA